MEMADIIQICIGIITFVGIISSSIFAIYSIRQNNNMLLENSRAYIVLYVDFSPVTQTYYIVIKNFGHSVGKLLTIDMVPKLDWKKTKFSQELDSIVDAKNILLAPSQKVASWFDFKDYPDKEFKVVIKYETLGRIYTENYIINLDYIKNIDWLTQYAFDDHTKDNKEVLYKINRSIQDLSDKFR